MWSLEWSRVEPATLTLAESMMRFHRVPGDRDLRIKLVEEYERKIADRTMRPCEWATAHCEELGLTYRVNGCGMAWNYWRSDRTLRNFSYRPNARGAAVFPELV